MASCVLLLVDLACRSSAMSWYKNHRKSSAKNTQPTMLLDLTSKNLWKPLPYQLHQAYSIRYHRPADSPLREVVQDLWDHREEQLVVDLLSPFMKTGGVDTDDTNTSDTNTDDADTSESSDKSLKFHNAVMRWKCSSLTEEEL